MKIRILTPGFEHFTGLFGTVDFEDGVSVDEVSKAEASRLGTILSIEDADTGVNPSVTQLMVDLHNKNTEELGLRPVELLKVFPGEVADNQPAVINQEGESTSKVGLEAKEVRSELSYDFTAEDLAALADKEGIAGLRAFADQYKVNDKSIGGLIKKLLDLKAVFAKPVQEEPVLELTEEQKAALAEAEYLAQLQALEDAIAAVVANADLTEDEKLAQIAVIEAQVVELEAEAGKE